jgi:hypothetical protein
MATTAIAIRAALESVIRHLTPRARPVDRFALLDGDDERESMAVPSGVFRRFAVEYGKGTAGAYHGFTDAETRREFTVAIVYPVEAEFTRGLDDLIESDLHDLRNLLNNYRAWAEALPDPTALLHAFVEEWEPRTERIDDRLILLVPVQIQFLESTS